MTFFGMTSDFDHNSRHLTPTTLNCGATQYRYQEFISDIAGQDIQAHNNNPEGIITVVRNWIRTASKRQTIPSGSIIWGRYQEFMEDLPQLAQEHQLKVDELIFNDYTLVITRWLRTRRIAYRNTVQGGN